MKFLTDPSDGCEAFSGGYIMNDDWCKINKPDPEDKPEEDGSGDDNGDDYEDSGDEDSDDEEGDYDDEDKPDKNERCCQTFKVGYKSDSKMKGVQYQCEFTEFDEFGYMGYKCVGHPDSENADEMPEM